MILSITTNKLHNYLTGRSYDLVSHNHVKIGSSNLFPSFVIYSISGLILIILDIFEILWISKWWWRWHCPKFLYTYFLHKLDCLEVKLISSSLCSLSLCRFICILLLGFSWILILYTTEMILEGLKTRWLVV